VQISLRIQKELEAKQLQNRVALLKKELDKEKKRIELTQSRTKRLTQSQQQSEARNKKVVEVDCLFQCRSVEFYVCLVLVFHLSSFLAQDSARAEKDKERKQWKTAIARHKMSQLRKV
jgi:hypothetical protein